MKHLGYGLGGTAVTAALVASAIIVPALATPGSGFTPSSISNGHYGALDVKADKGEKWDMYLRTKDDTDVAADRLTVAPGGQSGWHSHPAPIFVTVLSGQIEWYNGADPLCTSQTYHAGEAFIEPANRVHLVRNMTGASAEFVAIRVAPTGIGVRIDASKPTNCPTI